MSRSKPVTTIASGDFDSLAELLYWVKLIGGIAREGRGRPLCRSGANEKAVWMHLKNTVPSARPAKLDGWWYCIDDECDRVIGRA